MMKIQIVNKDNWVTIITGLQEQVDRLKTELHEVKCAQYKKYLASFKKFAFIYYSPDYGSLRFFSLPPDFYLSRDSDVLDEWTNDCTPQFISTKWAIDGILSTLSNYYVSVFSDTNVGSIFLDRDDVRFFATVRRRITQISENISTMKESLNEGQS